MITTYQIRHVLRIYGNQLKKKNLPIKDSVEAPQRLPDFVDISMEARKKQMLNKISDNLITQITPKPDQKGVQGNTSPDNPG